MTKTMKRAKYLLAFLAAAVLAFALAVPAFAADKNDSITINNAQEGETYNLYKLFDLTVNSETDPTAYTYTVNSAWAAFFAPAGEGTEAGPGAQYVTINNAGAVTEITDAAALAKAAANWSGKPANPVQSKSPEEGTTSVTFSGLDDGYWLVTSTLGTIAMAETTPAKEAVEINEKNPLDTIVKTVKEDSTNTYGEQNDAQVGDTIYFKSTVKIVKGTRNVVVHDKMDSGLSYTAQSVAIDGLAKETDYTVNESPADGDTFDIAFSQSWIDDLTFPEEGENAGILYFDITYTATLNENAVVKDENGVAVVDQNNKTHVSFGDGTNSTEDSTTTETHKFNLFKHAKNSEENLAGAVFSLKKGTGDDQAVVKLIKLDDNNYRVANGNEEGAVETFTTVENGDIVIWGVDSDNDYALEEITPPSGYNPLTAEVGVTVNADNTTRVDVENNSGTELPSTGGIGTTIFYVVGGIMVIGAAIFLVSRRRAAKAIKTEIKSDDIL